MLRIWGSLGYERLVFNLKVGGTEIRIVINVPRLCRHKLGFVALLTVVNENVQVAAVGTGE